MKQAKAWVFNQPSRGLTFTEIPFPVLGKGEILVKNTCCSICKSDLHTYTGNRPEPVPSILGHEIIGKVVECGSIMKDFRGDTIHKDDLITWSLMAFCGVCRNCKNGIPQKCKSLKKYGHEKIEDHFQLTGGFATHTHLYPGTVVYKLPGEIPQHMLAGLNCSWATVAAAMRLAGDVKGKNVLITGAGMLGIIATMMSKENGAENIIVVERNDTRLELAGLFGADFLILNSQKDDAVNKTIAEIVGDDGIDIIFEMTGSNSALELGFEIAGVGANIIMAGFVFPSNDISINPERIVRKLLQIKGIHNYIPEDLTTAIEFIQHAHKKYPLQKLFDEHIFNLDTINEAINHSINSQKHRVIINT